MKPIDITHLPDLLRIAEEVRRTSAPLILRRDREDVAIVMPLKLASRSHAKRAHEEADLAAFRSAAGSWEDVDADAFVAKVRESRDGLSRSPVDL